MRRISPIPEQLVKDLQELFPLGTPDPSMSLGEIMYKGGQRSVVDFLTRQLKLQQEEED